MEINGYMLREALKKLAIRADSSAKNFEDSLHAFKGEEKTHPTEVMKNYLDAEKDIARLQRIQDEYNIKVQVDVHGEKMSLCEAVKRVGGAGRAEKLWRNAAVPHKDRFAYREEVRKADEERPHKVMSPKELMDAHSKGASYAGALRNAIALGNSTLLSFDVDQKLLSE